MELHEDSGSFIPDQHPDSRTPSNTISPARRHWRGPAVATSTAIVAALCLYTGTAAHAAGTPAAAKVSALSLQAAAQPQTATGQGGVHGAFNLYYGAGGGVEFWFNPTTGSLTVAVGTGVGALGGGVLGTYAYGTAPAAGTYLYADASLSAGTVTTVNLAGTYRLVNGVFTGSVSATVEGRTLTITSDGSSTFKAAVTIAHGATGWTSPTYNYTYNFYFPDVVEYLWDPTIIYPDPDPDPYSLVDSDAGTSGTTVYSDASGTDGTVISSDGSSDSGSVSSDDGSSDDSSSGDDAGDDSGGGGGGGTSDDDGYPIMSE